MWLLRTIVFVSIFGIFESFAGPKNFRGAVHKHVLIVTDVVDEKTPTFEAFATYR